MKKLRLTGIITIAALFAFSTSMVFAKAADDDDDSDEPAPVTKTVTKARPAAKSMMKTDKKSDKKSETAAKSDEKPGVLPCPESIQVKPQDTARDTDHWQSFSDDSATYPLDTIMIYTAQKKGMARLESSKGTESFTEWQLPDNAKGKYVMVCSYAHTSVLLKHELDAASTSCRLSFDSDSGKPKIPQAMHKLTCQ